MIFLKGQCMGAAFSFFEEWNHAFIGVKSCFYRSGISTGISFSNSYKDSTFTLYRCCLCGCFFF